MLVGPTSTCNSGIPLTTGTDLAEPDYTCPRSARMTVSVGSSNAPFVMQPGYGQSHVCGGPPCSYVRVTLRRHVGQVMWLLVTLVLMNPGSQRSALGSRIISGVCPIVDDDNLQTRLSRIAGQRQCGSYFPLHAGQLITTVGGGSVAGWFVVAGVLIRNFCPPGITA